MNNKNIFLIEDDLIAQFIFEEFIKEIDLEGESLIFSNGLEAINYMKENKNNSDKLPDIILLDLNMPVMDGWEFLEEYEKLVFDLSKKCQIHVMSSSTHPEDKEITSHKQVFQYIDKPLDKNKVIEVLEYSKSQVD